jgi:hypothetical protein
VQECLALVYNVNLNWLIHGTGPSGLDIDTVEIELLDQEAAAGHGRETEDYAEKWLFQIPCTLMPNLTHNFIERLILSHF